MSGAGTWLTERNFNKEERGADATADMTRMMVYRSNKRL